MTIEKLIQLYKQYLDETVEERTHLLTNPHTGEKERNELKGDFDGFMRWLVRYVEKE